MSVIQTILHPTDFSASSQQAYRFACALARDFGARLVVIHVLGRPSGPPDLAGVLPHPDFRRQREERLRWLEPPCPGAVLERRLEEGDPAREIVDAARETRADVIVMGSRGRSGLGRLLLGSVAEQVLRQAPCPVLTLGLPPVEPSRAQEAARPG
jgi:nucleotide-binding universal stress UspA family protein